MEILPDQREKERDLLIENCKRINTLTGKSEQWQLLVHLCVRSARVSLWDLCVQGPVDWSLSWLLSCLPLVFGCCVAHIARESTTQLTQSAAAFVRSQFVPFAPTTHTHIGEIIRRFRSPRIVIFLVFLLTLC